MRFTEDSRSNTKSSQLESDKLRQRLAKIASALAFIFSISAVILWVLQLIKIIK